MKMKINSALIQLLYAGKGDYKLSKSVNLFRSHVATAILLRHIRQGSFAAAIAISLCHWFWSMYRNYYGMFQKQILVLGFHMRRVRKLSSQQKLIPLTDRWRSRELIYLTEADASLATIKKKKKRSCAWLSREAINEMFINANLHFDRSYCSFWWKFHFNSRITFRLCKCVSRNFAFLNFSVESCDWAYYDSYLQKQHLRCARTNWLQIALKASMMYVQLALSIRHRKLFVVTRTSVCKRIASKKNLAAFFN